MANNSDRIARVFRDYLGQPCWVEWRLQHDAHGSAAKVPYTPGTERKARTNDPGTFGTFNQCRGDQRGLVLSDSSSVGGVDLDGCRDPNSGRLAAWAQQIITDFGSYAEVSPSGTGVHIFAAGKPVNTRYKKVSLPSEPPTSDKQPGFELFTGLGHFITVTGERLADAPDELRAAPEAWARLIRRQALPAPSGRHRRSRKADDNRHDALFDYARRLRLENIGEDELRAAVIAANDAGNLHPDFATKGPCPARDVEGMVKYLLRKIEPDTRTVIELRVGELHEQVAAAEEVLAATGRVYRQGNERLVHCGYEQADASKGRRTAAARIRPYDAAWLTCELSEMARCVKFIVNEVQHTVDVVAADVPPQLAKSVLSRASTRFAELVGVIETPTLRPDGTVLAQPGYDPATGLMLFDPPPMPSIPERPTRGDAETALATLDGLLDEFPFVDATSRSVALSALITPVVRAAMEFAPLHEVVAPEAGTGKSFLINLAAAIATGRLCPVLGAAATNQGDQLDKAELDKKLTGALLAGQALIFIDNVNGSFGSSLLCQMLTQGRVQVRIFGDNSRNPEVRNTATVFTNGNNMEVEGDLIRRTVRCALDAQMENPWTRKFKSDPFKTIVNGRGRFVAATLTLVRAHLTAGGPGAERLSPFLGFDDWSRLVRGALVWLGRADPVASQEALQVADPKVTVLDELMEAWAEGLNEGGTFGKPTIPQGWRTVKELIDRNYTDRFDKALREVTRTREFEPISAVKVGVLFKKYANRVRRGMRIVAQHDSHTKMMRWQLLGWKDFLAARAAADERPATDTGAVVTLPTPGERRSSGRKAIRRRPEEE
jgi:putative DNA primase/helicase